MQATKLCSVIFVALALVLSVGPARAVVYTLTDENTSISIDSVSQAGVSNWTVDGVDVLHQQWFWYRIGSSGAEQSIDTLPFISATQADPATLILRYGSVSNFTISVQFDLTGGTTGSLTSDLGEAIKIKNYSGADLPFEFLQYSDFDLSSADTVAIDPTHHFVDQYPGSGGPMLSETVLTPAPNYAEANINPNTLNKLNNSVAHLDDNLTSGPGNATWAFQWDTTIANTGTFLISKDLRLAPTVPEPAAILAFGTILLLVGRKLSGRQT